MPLNQKGVAHFLLLLAAVGVIAYVVIAGYAPFKDNLFAILNRKPESQAAGTKSAVEALLNPNGDLWAFKKASNPQAIAAAPGATLPSDINSNFTSTELADYYSKSNAFLYFDSSNGELQDGINYTNPTFNPDKQKALFTAIKAKNSGTKIIGYVEFWEGHLAMKEAEEKSQNSSDPEMARFEAFYVHKQGVSPSTYSKANRVIARTFSNGGVQYLFDVTNPDYRQYLVNKMVGAMNAMGIDGVMSDHMYADLPGFFGIKDQMPADKATNWGTENAKLAGELKAAAPDKLIFGNVMTKNELLYIENTLFGIGRLDGIILEDPMGPSESPNIPFQPGIESWDQLDATMKMVQRKDKYAMIVVNTNQNGSGGDVRTDAAQKRYNSYYLGAYLQLYQPNQGGSMPAKEMLVHYFPTDIYQQYNSASFFKEWDIQLGNPILPYEQLTTGVFRRAFQNGYSYLNTTFAPYTIPSSPGTFYSTTDGSPLAVGSVIPPKTGVIYVTKAVYDQWAAPTQASNCTNRPNISKSIMTDKGMVVTITANTNDQVTANTIGSLQFTGFTNAQVRVREANGSYAPVQTSNFTYTANRDQVTFVIFQTIRGAAATVQLTATDRCGPYPLFFGGGSAFSWPDNTDPNSLNMTPSYNNNLTTSSMNGTAPRNHLEWFEVPQTSSYNVYRNNTKIATVNSGNTYNDDTAAPGTAYNYQMGAVVNGQEIKGAAKSITSASGGSGGTGAPGAFTLNTPEPYCVGTNSHLRLNWTQPATNPPRTGVNSGYFIWRDGVSRVDNNLQSTQYDDPVAKNPGQEYTYKIEAFVDPNSTFSNEQKIRAVSCTDVFNLSTVASGTSIPAGSKVVTWNMAPNAVKFTLKIDDLSNPFNNECNGNDNPGDFCITNTGSNLFTFNFQPGRTYNLQVFQNNSAGVEISGSAISVQLTTPGSGGSTGCGTNPLSVLLNDYFPITQVCEIPN